MTVGCLALASFQRNSRNIMCDSRGILLLPTVSNYDTFSVMNAHVVIRAAEGKGAGEN